MPYLEIRLEERVAKRKVIILEQMNKRLNHIEDSIIGRISEMAGLFKLG